MKISTGSLLIFIFILFSCKVNHLANVQTSSYRIEQGLSVDPDTSIQNLINPYKEKLDEEMNQVIGQVEESMDKAHPESTLGNWFADLIHEQTEVYLGKEIDFALVNYGGIRLPSIPEGPVTKGKIFELMPFDNLIVVLHLDAATLFHFLNHIAALDGWPVSRQLRFEISEGRAKNITIKGKPVEEDRVYKVSLPDYVANGGDKCSFLLGTPRDDTGVLVRDAIIDYVEKETAAGRKLKGTVDGRVKIVD